MNDFVQTWQEASEKMRQAFSLAGLTIKEDEDDADGFDELRTTIENSGQPQNIKHDMLELVKVVEECNTEYERWLDRNDLTKFVKSRIQKINGINRSFDYFDTDAAIAEGWSLRDSDTLLKQEWITSDGTQVAYKYKGNRIVQSPLDIFLLERDYRSLPGRAELKTNTQIMAEKSKFDGWIIRITPKKENQAAVSAYNPKSAAWMAQKEMYWEHQTDLVPDNLPIDLQLAFHHALGEVFGHPSEPKENGFWEPTVLGLERIEFNVTHKGVVKLEIFKPDPSEDNRNPKYGYVLSNVQGNLNFRHQVSHNLLQTLAEARQKSLEML